MTLDMAIKKTLYYSEMRDAPRALMCHYADVAQKELATDVAKIIKRFDISKSNSKEMCYPLPEDFLGIHQVIRRASALPVNWHIKNNTLYISDYGDIDIYYASLPQVITSETPGDYVFKVDARAQTGIPYYMAYRIAKDYAVAKECFEEWNKIIALIKMAQPKERK